MCVSVPVMSICICVYVHSCTDVCVCVSVLQKSGFCVFLYFLLLYCQIQDLSQKLISAARLADIELHRSIYQLWDHKHLLLCDALCEHWGNRSQKHMPGICILKFLKTQIHQIHILSKHTEIVLTLEKCKLIHMRKYWHSY